MQARQPIQAGHSGVQRRAGRLSVARLTAAFLVAGTAGCGPLEAPDRALELASQSQALDSTNGLSMNGLSMNGLSMNDLSSPSFITWFQQDPVHSDMIMRYVVRCAVPAGDSRRYTDSQTQLTYTWSGGLGLAPDWAHGQPATLAEQQLVSACLAAHVNKYGQPIPISILGQDTKGRPIPYTDSELTEYARREACFFGNLFTGEGIYVGGDGLHLRNRESTARACAFSEGEEGTSSECPPLLHAGSCSKICEMDSTKRYYTRCTYSGITYPAITTRLRREDIYRCGDGICQLTESCGRGKHPNNCKQDCGPCD